MGFDRAAGESTTRCIRSPAGSASQDVRITTRWEESYFASSLYGSMHECGHGLYEAGIDKTLQRTPLGFGESLALHESQSRMWENMVGRSRGSATCSRRRSRGSSATPSARWIATTLYRAVNKIAPSFIRVEADELTYGLHIVLRFELEQELIEGRLKVADLPEAWNARFKEYLGLDVPDDAHGVLQDVHWSSGLVGYFPTYALGNLIAGQLWRQAHVDAARPRRSARGRRADAGCGSGCARTFIGTDPSTPAASCCSESSAARSRSLRSSATSSRSSALSTSSSF